MPCTALSTAETRSGDPSACKPVQHARPMDAKRTAGLWTPAALIDGLHVEQRSDLGNDALRRVAAAAGFARAIAGVGGEGPPPSSAGAPPRASRAPQRKPRARPLGGERPKGAVNELRSQRTPLSCLNRSAYAGASSGHTTMRRDAGCGERDSRNVEGQTGPRCRWHDRRRRHAAATRERCSDKPVQPEPVRIASVF